ncbi:MAG: hypothetical protein U0787_13415 [Polyangia bacterium]|jgi:hypothetical protein
MSRSIVCALVMFVVIVLGRTAYAAEESDAQKRPKDKAGTCGEPPPPDSGTTR